MAPNTSPIWDQLRNHHPREYKDHLLAAVKAKENDKKRKSNDDEEANEMEHNSLADKRAKGDTQTTLSGWMQGVSSGSSSSVYPFNDPRAKERHRGILTLMILDLQPFSFVTDIGFQSLTDKDWKIMKNVVKVLNPFKSATEQLSANAACISESIPIVSILQKTLDVCGESDQGVKDLKKRLSDNLRRRTAGMEDLDNYTLATLLDNRFKNHFFQDPEKKIKAEERLKELLEVEVSKLADVEVVVEARASGEGENNITNTLEAMFLRVKQNVNNNPQRDASESVDKVLKDYLDSKLEDNNLSTWRKYEESAKDVPAKVALCKLAKKFLTPPPTSTATERLFSSAGNIASA